LEHLIKSIEELEGVQESGRLQFIIILLK